MAYYDIYMIVTDLANTGVTNDAGQTRGGKSTCVRGEGQRGPDTAQPSSSYSYYPGFVSIP